jgi:ferredoxin-NADP reductase
VEQVVGAVGDELGLRARHTVVYVCGNPDMILNVEQILMDRGFPDLHVKKELYWPPSSRPQGMRRAQSKDLTGTH